jgi:hypothetical protein
MNPLRYTTILRQDLCQLGQVFCKGRPRMPISATLVRTAD